MVNETMTYAFSLHGGAGPRLGRDYSKAEAHMRELAEAAQQQLESGGTALDVVERAVADMELSGLYVAGRGSAPNAAGHVELDASIMNGVDRAAGAVASIRDVKVPVSVARRVMEQTPHVMLAGRGANEFAEAQGFEIVANPSSYYILPIGVRKHEVDDMFHGTVGAVALDNDGKLAAATSTGGIFGKMHGRVGDTPIVGAGTWADRDVAVSCTGTGEYFIRTAAAVSVAQQFKASLSLEAAVDAVLDDVKSLGGDGGIIAVSAGGEIAMRYNSDGMKRAAVSSSTPLEVATFGAS